MGAVDVPESVIDVLTSLRDYLQDKCEPPMYVSDRRFMKALNLLQVAAYADGRDEVSFAFCMHAVTCWLQLHCRCLFADCIVAVLQISADYHCLHMLHVADCVMIGVEEGGLSGTADMHLMPVGFISN